MGTHGVEVTSHPGPSSSAETLLSVGNTQSLWAAGLPGQTGVRGLVLRTIQFISELCTPQEKEILGGGSE